MKRMKKTEKNSSTIQLILTLKTWKGYSDYTRTVTPQSNCVSMLMIYAISAPKITLNAASRPAIHTSFTDSDLCAGKSDISILTDVATTKFATSY